MMSTVGLEKTKVMMDMAKDINPEAEITVFNQGVTNENMSDFFKGVDLYVDGLDAFCLDIRSAVFNYIYQNNIPGISAGPIGMGSALFNVLPRGQSFADYFGLDSAKTPEDKFLRFMVGFAPKPIHRKSIVDYSYFDLVNQKVPSTPMGVHICAGVISTEALKVLLKRGPVISLPHTRHFDAYSGKLSKSWRPFGYKNPIQRLAFFIAKKMFNSLRKKNES